MKELLRKIIGPFPLAIAAVHWLVVLFAIFGEQHTSPFHYTYEPVLTQWLFVIDAIPLFVGGLFAIPVVSIFGDGYGYISWILVFVIFVPLITFQWLVLGWLLEEGYRGMIKDRTSSDLFAE